MNPLMLEHCYENINQIVALSTEIKCLSEVDVGGRKYKQASDHEAPHDTEVTSSALEEMQGQSCTDLLESDHPASITLRCRGDRAILCYMFSMMIFFP